MHTDLSKILKLSPNSLTFPFNFCFPIVDSLLQPDSLDWFCLLITCLLPPETNSTNRWYLWDSARHHCACDFCPLDILLSLSLRAISLSNLSKIFFNQMFLTITLSFLLPLAYMSVVFTLYICTCSHSALWACGESWKAHDLYVQLCSYVYKNWRLYLTYFKHDPSPWFQVLDNQ